MAHYAFLDENNIVTEVIVGRDETEVVAGISDWETHYGIERNRRCLRTSYSGAIRKNFAGVGFSYDPVANAFIPPKPFDSWKLNADFKWEAPVAKPTGSKSYAWNEETLKWVLIP
jgi:hypothetical protein